MNNNIFEVISEAKTSFDDYFKMTGNKSFKQFYYDWHVAAMIEPFADIAEYFCNNFDNSKEKFSRFVKEFKENVGLYNTDNPANSSLKVKGYSVSKDGKISSMIDEVEAFSFQFRQFIYSFATKEDHDKEFSNWPVKTNMPHAHTHGLYVSTSIFEFIEKNFESIKNAENKKEKANFFADAYLRNNIAKDYKYTQNYNFMNKNKAIQSICDLRDNLSETYDNAIKNNDVDNRFIDLFQVETGKETEFGKYRPNGYELEFYYPEKIGDYAHFISYLKEKNGWKKLHTTNKDSSVYRDEESAGVIMRDESLSRYDGLVAVEFASRIMSSKADEAYCTKLFDSFDKGYVNVHCSLHQHVEATDLDTDAYKRLIKRMMKNEEEIVGSFAAPARRDNKLLYATYISQNLSFKGKRDYPMLCVMTDICENKQELMEMSNFGRKYKTLNIMPDNTVEFRFMNAHFNKKFAEGFLQFNRDMVNSAKNNDGKHINRALLNKFSWENNMISVNNKTEIKKLPYDYTFNYDSYRPKFKVTKQAINGENTYGGMVLKALTQTGKLSIGNTAFARKVRENNGR